MRDDEDDFTILSFLLFSFSPFRYFVVVLVFFLLARDVVSDREFVVRIDRRFFWGCSNPNHDKFTKFARFIIGRAS
jgi:hypothetical protein